MNSRSAITKHSAASRKIPAATQVGALQAVRVDAAANDDTSTSTFSIFGDPLWGIAIASGMLFALLAALIAFG